MGKNSMIIEMPLSHQDQETLKLYNQALEDCRNKGWAYFDYKKLNMRIIAKSDKINFEVFNDLANNIIRKANFRKATT